jgi:DNA-binding MarR family transcriptional regulator
MTHEEIIIHLQSHKEKLNISEMAKQIGITKHYLTDAINQKEVKGKVRKLHKKHFPKITSYLDSVAFN